MMNDFEQEDDIDCIQWTCRVCSKYGHGNIKSRDVRERLPVLGVALDALVNESSGIDPIFSLCEKEEPCETCKELKRPVLSYTLMTGRDVSCLAPWLINDNCFERPLTKCQAEPLMHLVLPLALHVLPALLYMNAPATVLEGLIPNPMLQGLSNQYSPFPNVQYEDLALATCMVHGKESFVPAEAPVPATTVDLLALHARLLLTPLPRQTALKILAAAVDTANVFVSFRWRR
jgi:hypothetical protein